MACGRKFLDRGRLSRRRRAEGWKLRATGADSIAAVLAAAMHKRADGYGQRKSQQRTIAQQRQRAQAVRPDQSIRN